MKRVFYILLSSESKKRCSLAVLAFILFFPVILVAQETPKQLYDRGVMLGKEGHCAEANELLKRASKIAPNNMAITISLSFANDCAEGKISKKVGTLIFKSTIAGNGGDLDTAVSLAKQACNFAPKYAPAYVHLGVAYMKMVQYGKGDRYINDANNAYKKALEIDSNYGLAHHNLGVVHAVKREWKLAKKHLVKASSLGIKVPRGLMLRVEREVDKLK